MNRPSQFDYKRQISANIDWLDCFSMDHLTFPYTARTWQTDDGLPHTAVQAIAQTLDGYLWVGTRNGLARFDGVHFTSFDVKNTPQLQNPSITALCPDHGGPYGLELKAAERLASRTAFSLTTDMNGAGGTERINFPQ